MPGEPGGSLKTTSAYSLVVIRCCGYDIKTDGSPSIRKVEEKKMRRTLGLDLGSNSLGWAILDDITGDILDKGVLVFPEGIDAANDTLMTPAAIRRGARMGRRLKFRRKLRKWHLLSILIENGMCPLTKAELEAWKKEGKFPLDNKAFIEWLKATETSNPYCDRAACLDDKVPPFTLGRAIYHICQRRGFKSSRKDAAPDTGDDEADKKAADKKLGKVKTDINELSDEIRKSGARTLGEYFYKLIESQKDAAAKKKVRSRYTGRLEHYETEFTAIMNAQGIAEGSELRSALYKAIFMQRPLRSQKNLVGNCPLEPSSPRAMIGHPAFEEYRMLAFVNNLSFDDADGQRQPLTAADRETVCKAFLKASPSMKFGDVSKLFKKDPRFKSDGWKFHYYRDDETVSTRCTHHRIASAFGDLAYDEQMVFDALTFFDNDEKLRDWFKKHYPALDDKSVNKLVAIHPKEGNANYSLKAIRKILRFLRLGYELSQARFYAKLPDVIPDFDANEEQILTNLKEILLQYRQDKAALADEKFRKTNKLVPLLDRYFEYLRDNWGVDEEKWRRLYLRGDEAYSVDPDKPNRLPRVELGMIRNPLVQRSMTTLRRFVNFLFDHGKIDRETTIRIELARNVNDFATRQAYKAWQKKNETLREEAAAEITKLGVKLTEDAIERYLLWKEQNGVCLYTGKAISLADLLTGNKFDIEHTIPRSKSGDDSLANKTVCDAAYNRQVKRGNIPTECPDFNDTMLRPWRENLERLEKDYHNQQRAARGATDPEAHSKARTKALTTKFELDYWRDKLRRFDITADRLIDPEGGLSGFKKRQLVDTGIMCSHAVELLRSVYPATFAVNGAATAFARKAWGLQGDEAKDRSEHTHHAKDAMVIAALTPARFTAICTALKDDGSDAFRRPCDVCPSPWPDFADKVRAATDEILVKHVLRQTTLRQSSKRNALAKAHAPAGDPNGKPIKYVLSRGDTVRGPLHKETFYGCIADPATGELKKVVRKSVVGPIKNLESIVDKIVDPAIREIVEDALADLKAKGVKNIEPGMIKMPSDVPINKIRVCAPNATNAQMLRDHAIPSAKDYKRPYYVTSAKGTNFRLALFDNGGKITVEADNSLVWAQNHKKPDYVPLDQMPGFIGYLMPGSMALTYHEGHPEELEQLTARELCNRLYKLVKFESTGRITFRFHKEARASVVLAQNLKSCGKHAAGESKISVDKPHELLLVTPGQYVKLMLFENIHFKMMLDGSIRFIKR